MSARLAVLTTTALTVLAFSAATPPVASTSATLDELARSHYAVKNVRGFFSATYQGQTADAPSYAGRVRFTFQAARSKPTLGFLLGTGSMPPVYLDVRVKRGSYELFETGIYDNDQEHSCEVERTRARFLLSISATRTKGGFRIGWPHPTLGTLHLRPRECRGFNVQLDGIDPNGAVTGRVIARRLTIRQLSSRSRLVVLRGERTIRTPRKYHWAGKGTATIKWRMRFRLVRVR